MVNDVQYNVRENPKPDRGAKVAASRGLAKGPGERRQQQPCPDRMRVRQIIEMDRIGGDLRMLEAEIREENPQQLDELDRDEQRPQSDSREFSFQSERC